MRLFEYLALVLPAGFALVAATPAVTLPSLLEPFARPAARPDCAVKSAAVTSMTMRNWDIWHAMSATAHLKGTFTIANPATGDEYRLRNILINEEGDWHACVPSDKLLSACEYRLDMLESEVFFKLGWKCDGDTTYTATLSVDLMETKDVLMPVASLVVSPKSTAA